MKKEDIVFLKELQHEMLTQDSVGQANPRFWVVQELRRTYWLEDDYNGKEIVWDAESIGDSLEDLISYIDENEICENEDYKGYDELEELVEYLQKEGYDIYLVTFREEYATVENTFFLTLEECNKHIKANYYHYKKPRAYAMTAWRSPQVERLYKILENTNWDDFK